jgi:HEAT repeat protein
MIQIMKIGYLLLIVIVLSVIPTYSRSDDLLTKFIAETEQGKKEQLLNEIVRQPDAGPTLLRVALHANDTLTKWMSIRGIGIVKYGKAVSFLIDSLTHQHPYVRANAARALGEIKDRSASPSLIRLLGHEKDGGVIEQTTLALRMLGAKEAVPTLKKVAPHPSSQTRCWVLQAIGTLGGKKDVPFLAKYLYDANDIVDMCAAQAVEEITGQDFGFPKQSGPMSLQQGIERARRWWKTSKTSFRNLE